MSREKIKTRIGTRIGEIEVEIYEKDNLNLITLNSLKKAVIDYGVSISEPRFTFVPDIDDNEKKYPVCTIEISQGSSFVSGFGEAKAKTLKGQIDKDFPMTTARNRALSDAIITFLGLSDGKYYTPDQIGYTPEEKPAKDEDSDFFDGEEDFAEEKAPEEIFEDVTDKSKKSDEEKVIEQKSEKEKTPKEIPDYTIKIGKFKDKTLKEVANEEDFVKWVDFMSKKESVNPLVSEVLNLYQEYVGERRTA